ncbi:MAG: phage baseplate assembly protein V [Reyranella sp.]|uniref:phage baseplate assembly protein V n=1 Tax=Reyranella sp. TaxID=1929291 RepID=UPI002730AB41|nr:phage baseplate assembly protein V [Reyranella sp.]MDP1960872.1 phage baseplate assembly protein V [Reyranella sp.]MDP2375304.1 phage baseplate assembly protein V [Reyranella sp.]
MKAVRRALAPLARGVKLMVGRAIVRLVTEADGGQIMQLDGLADETLDGVEHCQDYGLASRPLAGARGVLLALAGARGQAVIVAVGDRRYRLTGLAGGEVALHDDQGQAVFLKRDQLLVSTPFKVVIEAGAECTVTAEKVVVISDDINLGGEGGAKVARVGDSVSGGVITTGSDKVKAS